MHDLDNRSVVFPWKAPFPLWRGPAPPQRRRVIIVGATASGIAAAFHLGRHCLLLERRKTLEDSRDQGFRRRKNQGRELIPLLENEIRLDVRVARISAPLHLLQLDTGERFVFDKLLCSLPLAALEDMIAPQLQRHQYDDEAVRCCLRDYDIELTDQVDSLLSNVDELAVGKRWADRIARALAEKFGNTGSRSARRMRLFEPRVVPVASRLDR